jgi:hypothetical protein
MSRSRMFGDDDPKNPSPRTTIVGGQPPLSCRGASPPAPQPQEDADLPPVPTGLQRLMRLASVDPAFARELGARRAEVAAAAGIELTASERAILQAIPAAHLQAMIGGLPPPDEDRRSFLRQTAASAVVLLGGAVLGPGCPVRGSRADVPPEPTPPRPDEPPPVPAGARIDVPPEAPPRPLEPTAPPAGIRPDVPAEPPPPRPADNQPTRGIRPDRRPMPAGIRPRPNPDDPLRPGYNPPTKGIQPDIPKTRGIMGDVPEFKGIEPDDGKK